MILFVTRRIPHPSNIGVRIRQRNLLEACATVAPVELVFCFDYDSELEGMDAIQPYCSKIHPVRIDWSAQSKGSTLSRFAQEFISSKQLMPRQSRLTHSLRLKRLLGDLVPRSQLVQIERLDMSSHIDTYLNNKQRKVPLILDLDDVESKVRETWLRLAPRDKALERFSDRADLLLLKHYQRSIINKFDRVLVTSETDHKLVGGGKHISIVPNGTDVSVRVQPDISNGKTILCLGTYGYWPNVDALEYFLRDIFPLIRIEIPDAQVLIVGKDMPSSVRNLEDNNGITVHSDVPDVTPYYLDATVSIVPLRLGGGTRLKILEAFALGTPIVTTSIGCQGISAINDEHLLVADTPGEFANSCITLFRDEAKREALARNARELVLESYSWKSIQSDMANIVKSVIKSNQSDIR